MLHGAETLYRDGVCVGLVKSAAYGYHIGVRHAAMKYFKLAMCRDCAVL